MPHELIVLCVNQWHVSPHYHTRCYQVPLHAQSLLRIAHMQVKIVRRCRPCTSLGLRRLAAKLILVLPCSSSLLHQATRNRILTHIISSPSAPLGLVRLCVLQSPEQLSFHSIERSLSPCTACAAQDTSPDGCHKAMPSQTRTVPGEL